MLESKLAQGLAFPANTALDRYKRFGIELEFENARRPVNTAGSKWRSVPDGSLRNHGIEYVSLPLTSREVPKEVRWICAKAQEARMRATPRCGVHVHLNVRPYTLGQIASVATLYGLLEPSIFARYAEGRERSTFCCPQYSNTALQQALRADFIDMRRDNCRYFPNAQRSAKYAALNYSSLARFGTLEARQLAGTIDPDVIIEWVQFLSRMLSRGVGFTSPEAMLDHYERVGLEALQEEIMNEQVEVDQDDQEDAVTSVNLFALPGEDGMRYTRLEGLDDIEALIRGAPERPRRGRVQGVRLADL